MARHSLGMILAAVALALPASALASSDLQDKFEKDVVTGDIVAAQADYEALKKDDSIFNKPTGGYLEDCGETIAFLQASADFKAAVAANDPTTATDRQTSAVVNGYGSVDQAIGKLSRGYLFFAQPTVDSIDSRMQDVQATYYSYMKSIETVAANKRQDAEEADRKAAEAEQARQDSIQKKQEEDDARAERRAVAADKAAVEKHKARLAALNKEAKAKGYQGIYATGIARFVYAKQQHGGSEKDIRYVFWPDVSEDDRHRDSEFHMANIASGYGIYTLSSCCDAQGQYVEMTIAVPAGKSAMSGQTLTGDYYLYVGNEAFETVNGTTTNIPVFQPVKLE